MRASRELKSTRSGFTLVEILVVIAIITVLVGLVAAGVFAVIGSQRSSNTQNTMRAVYKAVSRQMKYVVDKADKETIPASVLNNLAGGDAKRARVIWKKLRLKQEFPMTFAEALTPSNGWNNISQLPATDLPALTAYVKALKGLSSANSATQPFLESSTLVLLALQQNRGGTVLQPDELGSYALDINKDGLKELIDGWNSPIAFFRFPTSNDVTSYPVLPPNPANNALDSTNPAGPLPAPGAAGPTAATYRDPYDPEGTLINQAWNNSSNPSVTSFEQLCHLVHTPNVSSSGAAYAPLSTYMLPTLVSSGPDGKWGLNSSFGATYPAYYGAGADPDMSIDPNGVTPPPPAVNPTVRDSNDNIYSYSLNLDN